MSDPDDYEVGGVDVYMSVNGGRFKPMGINIPISELVSDPDEIVIWTEHMPISVNKAYRNATSRDGKRGGRIKTESYRTWLAAFSWDVARCMKHREKVMGAYEMEIVVDMTRRHKLADLSNFLKTTEDALKHHGVIEDDRFCEKLTMSWGNPSGGTSITIRPLGR